MSSFVEYKLTVVQLCWNNQTHTHWQIGVRPGSRSDFSLFTCSLPGFLHLAPCLSLSEAPSLPPPPPLLSPLPLKGTLLGPTVCVMSWAGRSQSGMQRCVSVFTFVYMCFQWALWDFFRESPYENVYFKPYLLSLLTLTCICSHTHTRSHLSVILQYSSTAGSRGRRWSRRLMDMFVYLFVLDMINWSAS